MSFTFDIKSIAWSTSLVGKKILKIPHHFIQTIFIHGLFYWLVHIYGKYFFIILYPIFEIFDRK